MLTVRVNGRVVDAFEWQAPIYFFRSSRTEAVCGQGNLTTVDIAICACNDIERGNNAKKRPCLCVKDSILKVFKAALVAWTSGGRRSNNRPVSPSLPSLGKSAGRSTNSAPACSRRLRRLPTRQRMDRPVLTLEFGYFRLSVQQENSVQEGLGFTFASTAKRLVGS